jgi:type I restriction enzyme S subunit
MAVFSASRIDPASMLLVNVEDNERQNEVRRGDIFFTTSSETPDEVGMSSVLLDEVGQAFLNSFCFGFRLHDFNEFHPRFARYLLRGPQFRRDIRELAQGATRYNLSKQQLMKIEVLLPPAGEQEEIATVLESADEGIFSISANIDRLRREKSALMQQLLTGKRRVTV